MIYLAEKLSLLCRSGQIALITLCTLFLTLPSLADIRGTDINGKPVILRSDGTWSYIQVNNTKQQQCQRYSNNAVQQQRANLNNKCGFSGGHWHLNYNAHHNWCMRVHAQARGAETIARRDALNRCTNKNKAQACSRYANNAVDQQKANLARRCGYSGARWHQNYSSHYAWCMRANAQNRGAEYTARRDALKRCSGSNQGRQTKYLGCFNDRNERDLNGFFSTSNQMTNQRCINTCRSKGFRFAGTQYFSQCFCGNSYGRYGRAKDQSKCDAACTGNPNEKCGGFWLNRVYQLR